jgi:hypothetical protein
MFTITVIRGKEAELTVLSSEPPPDELSREDPVVAAAGTVVTGVVVAVVTGDVGTVVTGEVAGAVVGMVVGAVVGAVVGTVVRTVVGTVVGGTTADTAIGTPADSPSTVASTVAVPETDDVKIVAFVPAVVFPSAGDMLPGPSVIENTTGIPSGTAPLPEVSAPAEFQVRFALTSEDSAVVMACGDAVTPRTSHGSYAAPPPVYPAGLLFFPHQLLIAVTLP